MRAHLTVVVALACLPLACQAPACRGSASRSGVVAVRPVTSEVPSASTSAKLPPAPAPRPHERVVAVAEGSPQQIVADEGYLYFRTDESIARVPKAGGPVEVLATTHVCYRETTLAVDASGVYWAQNDTASSTLPPPWKGSVWRVSKTGGDAKELASLDMPPRRLVLDATSLYVAGGDFTYFGTGKLQGAGGIFVIDKLTGKSRELARDFCAESLVLDGSALYWASCDPNDGMILTGGLYRMSKLGGPKSRVPLTLGGAVAFPLRISLYRGRFYFLHGAEMSGNDQLCSFPKAGGTDDCSLVQPLGAKLGYLFDGDDVWMGSVPDKSGIDSWSMKDAQPTISVTSLVSPGRVGSLTVPALGAFTIDDSEVYWSEGSEIRARPKATFEREPGADAGP